MDANDMKERVERILSAHGEIDRRFSLFGGVGNLVGMYEQMKYELERVSSQELDDLCNEVKNAIDSLMRIDNEYRKVKKLKYLVEAPNAGDDSATPSASGEPPNKTEAA